MASSGTNERIEGWLTSYLLSLVREREGMEGGAQREGRKSCPFWEVTKVKSPWTYAFPLVGSYAIEGSSFPGMSPKLYNIFANTPDYPRHCGRVCFVSRKDK